MKRGVIVAGATVVGLVGVLSFHTSQSKLSLTTTAGAPAGGTSPTTAVASRKPTSTSTTAPAATPTTAVTTTTAAASSARTATGQSVDYNYGILAVAVTATGHTITKVTIASIDDGGSFRSQSIDQQSIPILEQEALKAQSANIQSVSGASYNSAGFTQSLQSALSQLGI